MIDLRFIYIKNNSSLHTQVWSGNKDCKPVSWEECVQKPYEEPFPKDVVNCTQGGDIPYRKCKPVMRKIMTVDFVCKPKSAVKCETKTTQKCIDGEYF